MSGSPLSALITGSVPIDSGKVPLVAIPTTAGTGSEATHFAVVYHEGKKFSVAHRNLLPDFAIIDPELTCSMPKSLAASTGLDALCQAIESIWAVGATGESATYAIRSLYLALEHLESAVENPTAGCPSRHVRGGSFGRPSDQYQQDDGTARAFVLVDFALWNSARRRGGDFFGAHAGVQLPSGHGRLP